MKKWLGFVLVGGIGLFLLTACSWWSGPRVDSLEFAYSSGALPPEYYNKADMTIKPDYSLRTISIDYVAETPYKKNPVDGDNFKGNAIIGGEYFDRFEEVVKVLGEWKVVSGKEPCVGGYSIGILARGLEGKDDAFIVSSCLEKEDPVSIIKPFYDDVVILLTKTVD